MKNPEVEIFFKGIGSIKLELFRDMRNTTNNFLELATNKFYDGLAMHRMVKNFVVQGGCPDGSGMGGPGYTIDGEFSSNGFSHDHEHLKGRISMARSTARNSAGSQFFICTKDAPHLDGDYACFGEVIEGMDILDKLNDLSSQSGKPISEVVIEKIEVELFNEKLEEVNKLQ